MNSRKIRTYAAWVLLVGSCIGWPLSTLTWAKDEPRFVLGLSWLAIVLTAWDILTTSQVHEEQQEQQDDQTPDTLSSTPPAGS